MDKQVYITADGKMVARRNRKLIRQLVIWVSAQMVWGIGCTVFNISYRPHPFKYLELVQWTGVVALWYLQFRVNALPGIDITFKEEAFRKWDIIMACGTPFRLLIFKKTRRPEGWIYRGYAFELCRRHWQTVAKLWWFRLLIILKLIK